MATLRRTVTTAILPLLVGVACVPPDSGDLGTFEVTETLTSNTCGAQFMTFELTTSYDADIAVSASQGTLKWTPSGETETDGTYDSTTGAFSIEQAFSTQVVAPSTNGTVPGCTIDTTDIISGLLEVSNGDGGYTLLGDTAVATTVDTGVVATDTGTTDTGTTDTGTTDAGTTGADVPNTMDGGASIDAGVAALDATPPATQRIVFSGTHQIIYGAESTGDCSSQIGAAPMQFAGLPCTITFNITGVLQ